MNRTANTDVDMGLVKAPCAVFNGEDATAFMSGALPVPADVRDNPAKGEGKVSTQNRNTKRVHFVDLPSTSSSNLQRVKYKVQKNTARSRRPMTVARGHLPVSESFSLELSTGKSAAIEALSKLQPLKSKTLQDAKNWTTEDEKITRENIALLREATDDIPSLEGQSRKRRYSQSSSASEANNISTPSKRAKSRQTSERYLLKPTPLSELQPQPLRIEYTPHPSTDRDDKWFITEFRRLFAMLDKFAETYFGVHDLETDETFQPWSVDLGPEFMFWAEQIVEDDEMEGSWDRVLRNTTQRRWLIMGIVMKILKTKIFDEDLFGADEEEKKLLMGIERSFLKSEGFRRTQLRSQTVRSILADSPVSHHFYPCVAHLTAQIALLMNPLSNYLYSVPRADSEPLPNIQDQYQALHNIVSTAAYLSLCIRSSPTIFHFVDVSVGDAYDHDGHHNIDPKGYWRGVDIAKEEFARELKAWRVLHKRATAAVQETKTGTRRERNAKAVLKEIEKKKPLQPDILRKPMTKYSIWPVITRYTPGGEEDDAREAKGDRVDLRDKDGFRIHQISKAAVVLYFGKRKSDGKMSLPDFVEKKQKELSQTNTKSKHLSSAAKMTALGAGFAIGSIFGQSMGWV